MLTQEQALAELRQLNQELGLAEDDGIPMTQAQAEAELRRLDEELASTPESFDEYVTRRKQEDSRSIGEKTSAFTDSFLTGAGTLAQEGGRAIKQLFSGGVGAKELKGVFQVGIEDFGRFAKTLGGAAMDNFYSDEEEMKREYERYKDNFLYNQNVRTAMLNTFDEEGRDFVSFGANFVDPTMLVPVAGQVAKLGSIGLKSARLGKLANAIEKGGAIASKPTELVAKGTRKAIEKTAQVGSKIAGATGKAGEVTAKAAALPRNFITSLAGKAIDPKVAGSGILGAQVTGAFTGAVPGLGLLTSAEVAGYIANKSGRGMERVLTALGSEAGQKRFLQRLAMQADSPTTRKYALYAHKLGGTRMGDLAFNSLVNGISVSTLNGALAYASTDNIEELGQAMGAGFAMGGALPVGQPGMKAGKSQAARDQSSVNFLEAKLGQDQLKQFRKMDPDARLAFATVEEAGIKAPKLMFVDKNLMLETLREDDPNIRQAPNAYYNQTDNTIYVNENGRASKSSKEAFDILTHELGHGFITQAIKDDPLFARKILQQYEAKPGEKAFEFTFTKDSAGAPIDSIMLNEKAQKIASAYDNIQEGDKSIGVGQNANILAQEIGAEQFAMMMVDNPNYFNTIEPSLRQKLLEGSRKVLTLFGAVDGNTGNPLDVSISPLLKRNKTIRNLYKNYTKQRDASIAHKVDLAEKGVSMKVRKGESADQAVDRMYGKVFGAKSFSLDDVSGFRINNKKIKKILTDIKDRLVESPEGSLRVERNQIVGKELNKDLKEALLFGDKLGNKNVLLNAMLEGIKNLTEFNFLYRAGKPSKYSDNELRARIVTPFQIRVTGLSPRSKSAASVKMDAYDLAYLRNNVEVLAREGFTDKPEDLIKEARRVAQQALEDPEGRINPEGNYENELVTAVFGQPESAQFIKNPKLRQLLEDKKLKHSIRSYDVDALAGLVPTGKSGIAFDWFNIKNNYSPFDDKLFMPTEIQEGSPGSFFRPKSSRDKSAKLRTFKSPVYLKDGSRLSGVADNPEQNPFYGYDKNGQEFSQRREYVNPQDITKSRDSDRTANQIRNELESGQKLFHPAYHGTPHTFAPEPGAPLGKFRTSAIGTGEGAQAYGHGLYFAGKKEVADYYRSELTKDQGVIAEAGVKPTARLLVQLESMRKDKVSAKDMRNELEYLRDDLTELEVKEFDRYIDYVQKNGHPKDKGSLYKVELAPKENEYLLYDKTLGEQTKDIQDKLRKVLTELEGEDLWEYRKDLDYRDITDNALENVPEPEISRRLKEAGIPGIKYLDGSSRSKGEGDYNYVIFDEADVQITDKLFMPAEDVMTAVNVRNELNNKFADLIVSGQKSIETRRSRSLDNLIGNRVKIVRTTGKGDEARVIGEVTVGEPIQYRTRAEFAKDYDKHLVDEDSDFAFQDGGKFGYPMINPERYDSPYPMPKRKGIVYTKEVGGPDKLFMPASEAGAGKPSKGDTTPASVQSWDDANPTFGANFTKGMAKDNKEAAALLRKSYEDEFGEPIKAQDFTQEQVEWLGDMLAQEGEAALGRTGNAVNWYTSAVEKALSVAEEIFPEIGQEFEAKDRFLGALSITSQNMRVMDNAKAAVSQYEHKIRTGKFNYNIKHGAKADAITSNLKLYDKVEAKMGVDKLNDFLDADFTVKELIEWGRDFFGDKKFSIAGYSTDKVKGSAIFGPKIGQGFFQNLRGNYDPVTVDLWLRRTYGRLTGLSLDTALSPGDIGRIIYAVRNNKGKRKFAGLEMPDFLKGVSISGKLQKNGVANFKISDKAFESLFGDNTIGRDNYEAIYEFAEKLNREWERSFAKANTDVKKAKDAIKKAKKEDRGTTNLEKQLAKFEAEKVAIGKEKPQWAKAGSTVNDKLKPIDVPSNAERAVITKAFNVALKSLKDKGINLTPADLQATLWYPEKDIWAYLKGESSDSLNMSYDTAMEVIRDQR